MPTTHISYKALLAISAIVFLAVAPMPYGYYTFMKIIVFLSAGYEAYIGYQTRQKGVWPWMWGIVAIVFNPLFPITMTKEIWAVTDILIGGLFGISAFKTYKKVGVEA